MTTKAWFAPMFALIAAGIAGPHPSPPAPDPATDPVPQTQTTHTTTLDDLPSGVAEGIDDSGALLVRVGPSLRTVGAGDVSVRAAAEPPR